MLRFFSPSSFFFSRREIFGKITSEATTSGALAETFGESLRGAAKFLRAVDVKLWKLVLTLTGGETRPEVETFVQGRP